MHVFHMASNKKTYNFTLRPELMKSFKEYSDAIGDSMSAIIERNIEREIREGEASSSTAVQLLPPDKREDFEELAIATRFREPDNLMRELALRALEVGSRDVLLFIHGAAMASQAEMRLAEEIYTRVRLAKSTVANGGYHTPAAIDAIVRKFPEESREEQRQRYIQYADEIDAEAAREANMSVEQYRWHKLEEAKQLLADFPELSERIDREREALQRKDAEYTRRREAGEAPFDRDNPSMSGRGKSNSPHEQAMGIMRSAANEAAHLVRNAPKTPQQTLPTMHLQSVPDSIPTTPTPSQIDNEAEILPPTPLKPGQKATREDLAQRREQAVDAGLQARKRGSKKVNGEQAA